MSQNSHLELELIISPLNHWVRKHPLLKVVLLTPEKVSPLQDKKVKLFVHCNKKGKATLDHANPLRLRPWVLKRWANQHGRYA
jgi:hypothetical protein